MAAPTSDAHARVFAAVADAFWPRLDGDGPPTWKASASDLGVAARLPEVLDRLPAGRPRRDLLRVLGLLGSPAGGMLLYGRPRAFDRLPPAAAQDALRRMAVSPAPPVRHAFFALKSIVGRLLVTPPPDGSRPQLWDDMGYPGPDGPPPTTPKALRTETAAAGSTLRADAVVVGSGAGGGIAAALLAQAGLDVVVIERGPYRNEADFHHRELDTYGELYLDGLWRTTEDGGVTLLAGRCLGGGTVVNYTTSIATPPSVRAEWDRVSGLDGAFTGAAFQRATDAVLERMHVTTDASWPAPRDAVMERGLRALGWRVAVLPRNVDGCPENGCGFCTLGCRHGAKRSSLRTWLEDAQAAGARFVVDAEVDRVLLEGGRAVGVAARTGDARFEVRAPTVVVACGALDTPALLLRSGISLPALGRNLLLHPVTAVSGLMPEPVDPWTGTLQSRMSDEFADLDGAGYGFRFETTATHPSFPAAWGPWKTPELYKRHLHRYRHVAQVGVLLRDRHGGRVTVARDGTPRWRYRLSRHDTAHVREGVRRAAEVLAAAGAEEVVATTSLGLVWRPAGRETLQAYLSRVDAIGYRSGQTAYASFHQMGTAAMGSDPRRSVVDGDNRVHGTDGLYVLDGSCFPTSSGVNPMISIAAIAHRGASRLAERLA